MGSRVGAMITGIKTKGVPKPRNQIKVGNDMTKGIPIKGFKPVGTKPQKIKLK